MIGYKLLLTIIREQIYLKKSNKQHPIARNEIGDVVKAER
ncbi:hypothetical protein SAMN05661044_00996 [Olivibacter domesticus]|uniref:Uncharacterized protein n=1 Tax=Olivibacter domesticus TaxID=407022 RepID=A0A1H7JF46_OLID1|nr:hypothetical protein SAMN05661044_00996 [Olivibacter domesticus]